MSTIRMDLGDGYLIPIYDGELELDSQLFSGISDQDVSSCLARINHKEGPLKGTLNAYVYKTNDRTILIDSGGKAAIPGTGKLLDNLKQAGVSPDDVDTVLCTHLHPDHIGGLIENGESVFKNAELRVHQLEPVFWQDKQNRNKAAEEFHGFFDLANNVLSAYADRMSTFEGESEVSPGVQAVPLPGHTPGHCGFQIGEGESGLLIWGDIVHVQALQMPFPKASIAFDVDEKMAVKTRENMFERAVTNKLRVAGMHLAYPGIGYVVRQSNGFWFESADV